MNKLRNCTRPNNMKIGIFGGSFNPIHTGHAILANYLVSETDLDAVWLMVAPRNPIKSEYDRAYDLHRLRMTEMVTRRINGAITSGLEFSLPYPSYTINTLNTLSQKFPDDEFALVIGADNWAIFNRWRNADEIIARHEIYVYPRRGYEIAIPDELKDRVKALDSPLIEISSTMVREKLSRGDNLSFYLPDDVYQYILERNLYTTAK